MTPEQAQIAAAIAALEAQRATLGDAVLELATAPLRARLAGLLRPAGLQHRQVTVLFADVVGSTALAQGRDAGETLAILSAGLRRMADIVQAHQGRVLRFTGDDFEGTAERQFDHHLLHQVTYDTLLKAERKLGHGAAARWLAERTKGRGAEFLAMTGEHAERAGETALAIDCFEQAGQEAKKRYANTAAMSWLRSALCLLGDTDPGRRWELLFSMQNIASTVGDAPAHDAVHAEMGRLLERHPADERQAQLWVLQAMLADRSGDTAVSERLLWQAIEPATR